MEKNIDVPMAVILKAFRQIPEYNIIMTKHHGKNDLHYMTSANRQLGEMDIAIMKNDQGYIGFLGM